MRNILIISGLGFIGRKIKLAENWNQTRNLIHVLDLCDAIISSLGLRNMIVNVGSGHSISHIDLLRKIEDVCGKTVEIEKIPIRSFDLSNNELKIELIKDLTDWQPIISLDEGIRMMLQN